MRAKVALSVLTCFSAFALTASAWACLPGTPPPIDRTVSPGDRIDFSVSGVEQGADWRVIADGRSVKSGTNAEPYNGLSDYFEIGDYGDEPRQITFFVDIQHQEDYPEQLLGTVQYVPAPAAESPAASKPAEPLTHGEAQGQSPPALHSSVPRRDSGSSNQHQARAPQGESAEAAVSPPTQAASGRASRSEPASETRSNETERSSQQPASVANRVVDALGSTTKVGPAEVPTLGLLAMALIFVAGTALAAFAIYLLRRGPDPEAAIKAPAPLGHDPVEVELQEMIAEEMARQLLSDLDLGERTVSSR